MTQLALFGSTGSIGTQTLQLLDALPGKYQVSVLAANNNAKLLLEQILKYKPRFAAVRSTEAYRELKPQLPPGTKLLCGQEEINALAAEPGIGCVMAAVVGIAGLPVVLNAIEAGKKVCLANKEALVAGGKLVTEALRRKKAILYPVDSEHSAIFQCLNGENKKAISRLLLTASGGPFRSKTAAQLKSITVKQALSHPNWSMGRKISVDSATLMNKGLEVIEAHWLFGVPAERIEVLVHPESIVHSLVEFTDSSVLAQMGLPDMRLPILYALEGTARPNVNLPKLNLETLSGLHFAKPDVKTFRSLPLAYEALSQGGIMPAVLNAANEIAVEAFLAGKLPFCDIPRVAEHTMEHMRNSFSLSLDTVLAADREARALAKKNFSL